jgi:hypothetical protein
VILAIGAANAVTFLAIAVAGLSLIERYLIVGLAMLAALAAIGTAGWVRMAAPPRRRWAIAASAATSLVLVASLPSALSDVRSVRGKLRDIGTPTRDLADILRTGRAHRALMSCDAVYVPSTRYFPVVRYELGRSAAAVRSAQLERPRPGGVAILPAVLSDDVFDYRLDPKRFSVGMPHGYRVAATNRSFVVATGPACRPG